jgi:hypothetical protein
MMPSPNCGVILLVAAPARSTLSCGADINAHAIPAKKNNCMMKTSKWLSAGISIGAWHASYVNHVRVNAGS